MKIVSAFILLLASACSLRAQTGSPVDVSGYPSTINQAIKFFDYDASSNLTYICYARPLAPNPTNPGYNFSLTVTGGTLTSIVVATNVGTVTTVNAHGLFVGNKIVVSGSATTALNGTYYVQTVPSTTTFTITTSGVSNATYTDMTVSGSTPLQTGAIWSIQKLTYNSSNEVISSQWANGTPGTYNSVCANRAQTTGATAIYYQ
jgi:hypothetical protein